MSARNRLQLEKEIEALQARLTDLKTRLPAHSIPPAMMAELDEIEDQLERAENQLMELSE